MLPAARVTEVIKALSSLQEGLTCPCQTQNQPLASQNPRHGDWAWLSLQLAWIIRVVHGPRLLRLDLTWYWLPLGPLLFCSVLPGWFVLLCSIFREKQGVTISQKRSDSWLWTPTIHYHHLSSWELPTHWVWLIASVVNEFERREMVWSAQVRRGCEITVWKLTWAARHFLTITPLHKMVPWGGISGATDFEGGHLLFDKKYQSFSPISFEWISLVTGHSDGKLITVTQCFKANPSKLLVKFCFLFVWFYSKRWEEGGNIVQNSVLSSTEWNWYGFIT